MEGETERETERERGREKRLVVSYVCANWGSTCSLGMCPDQGLNPQHGLMLQSTEPPSQDEKGNILNILYRSGKRIKK